MRTPRLAPLLILWLGLASVSPLAADAGSGSNAVFPRPDGLAPAVAFWTRVYTELDTNSGFIHDNRELKSNLPGATAESVRRSCGTG